MSYLKLTRPRIIITVSILQIRKTKSQKDLSHLLSATWLLKGIVRI